MDFTEIQTYESIEYTFQMNLSGQNKSYPDQAFFWPGVGRGRGGGGESEPFITLQV